MTDDELVSLLLDADEHAGGGTRYQDAADAITKLRAERDDAIRYLADWSNRCGQTEAERDALAALLNRVLSCTDLHGWNGEKASLLCDEIDAALAKEKP